MPAIVRVKRRIDEEPLNAFVLNGKKRRRLSDKNFTETCTNTYLLEGDENDEVSTILKFAGTLQAQDNEETSKYARLSKESATEIIKQKSRKPKLSATERSRQAVRQSINENRFRVVNRSRTTFNELNESDGSLGSNAKEVTIVDIEKHNEIKDTPEAESLIEETISFDSEQNQQPVDSDTGFVYDVYLPENEQQADDVDLMDDNYLSIRVFDDILLEDCYQNGDESDYDSEDSNDENYYTNDYPDESDATQNEEDDDTLELRNYLSGFVLNDDDEDFKDIEDDDESGEASGYKSSSSDDAYYESYGDPYVHSIDVDNKSFMDDIDHYTED